jgi:hypothetical protein
MDELKLSDKEKSLIKKDVIKKESEFLRLTYIMTNQIEGRKLV